MIKPYVCLLFSTSTILWINPPPKWIWGDVDVLTVFHYPFGGFTHVHLSQWWVGPDF